MRLVATADLHWNHPRSKPSAEAIIDEINRRGGDLLVVAGDVGVADGDVIESCLSRFTFAGPKLFVPGNHELWTKRSGVDVLDEELPRRIRALGWHWLPGEAMTFGGARVIGSIGWYDYGFAEPSLNVPTEFYRAKSSPAVVARLGEPPELAERAKQIESACPVVARWNDGRFAKLSMSDEELVERELNRVRAEILRSDLPAVVVLHTVPDASLMPPRRAATWDFARAYLGSPRWGRMLCEDAVRGRVTHVLCGHSHAPARSMLGDIQGINIGSGYRAKHSVELDLSWA
jgi:hypothetical protein